MTQEVKPGLGDEASTQFQPHNFGHLAEFPTIPENHRYRQYYEHFASGLNLLDAADSANQRFLV
jgi:hypothetical protein